MSCAPDLKSPDFFLFLGLFGTTPAAIVPIWCFFFAVQHRLVIAALACLKKRDTWALDDWVLHRSRAWPQPVSRLLFGT